MASCTGTIYDLIPKVQVKTQKPPRYVSKFRETARRELQERRLGHKTWGLSKVQPPHPDRFLKKHSKEPQLPTREPFRFPRIFEKKATVPKAEDRPLMGMRTTKNFINHNAINNITTIPKKPAKKFVDTRNGDTHNLIPSGLEPVYVHKKPSKPKIPWHG